MVSHAARPALMGKSLVALSPNGLSHVPWTSRRQRWRRHRASDSCVWELPDIRPSVSLKISMARTGVDGVAATELLVAFRQPALFFSHSSAKNQVQWEISVPKRRLTLM